MPTLADIMTRDVFTTPPATAVAEVAASMVRGRFGSAMVMQGPLLLGILTERDVLRAAASGKDLTASTALDWMTRDPETATPDIDAEEAAATMLSKGFRHLPVCDDNGLVGIVSLRDVLSARIGRRVPE